MAIDFGMGDDIGDIYPYAKFHYDLIRAFCSPPLPCPRACRRIQIDSASFFGGAEGGFWRRRTEKPPAPIFLHSIWQMTSFRTGMYL